jgi:hypothetical protein
VYKILVTTDQIFEQIEEGKDGFVQTELRQIKAIPNHHQLYVGKADGCKKPKDNRSKK